MSERRLAVGLSFAMALATAVPYVLAAAQAPPGMSFSGFLMNPIDGFSYLAKMRQGLVGGWLFRLPYAADPGAGTFLFPYHLLLGHLARLIEAPLLSVYHAARILAAAGMFSAAYLLFERLLADRVARWAAFLLTLFGSGLGWLAAGFGILSPDLWVPEAIPFLTGYANAHFPLAASFSLLAVWIILGGGRRAWMAVGSLGLGLALVQPFALATLLGALALWWAIERWRREAPPFRWQDAAALLAGGLPALLYGLWVTWRHPWLHLWSLQNITPSPTPLESVLGWGLILLLAAVGTMRGAYWKPQGRLLIAWFVVGVILMYLPIPLQRRMVFGLFFPLAALAGKGIASLVRESRTHRLAVAACLVAVAPSNVLVISAGLASVRQGDDLLVMSEHERAAYGWIGTHVADSSLVLAGPQSGNRLPAFASVRVLYGHPFETPRADDQRALVQELYTKSEISDLTALGVDYVLYTSHEQELGHPPWLAQLQLVFKSGSAEVYELP